jgi:tryptophan 2,3-dioxygenase
MDNEKIDAGLYAQLQRLEAKYDSLGQDLSSYLEGLIHADYLTYWDYIHLDTLLSLQNPRTGFPDEKIFIVYHQITELYFNLIVHEMKQIQSKTALTADFFLTHLNRINRYFQHLVSSFDVMVDGMDRELFLSFRLSLLPASGFQSAQYREIEIRSTHFYLLTGSNEFNKNSKRKAIYENIYWRKGATELASGKKTLTLRQFEDKYSEFFLDLSEDVEKTNLLAIYTSHFEGNDKIKSALRDFDTLTNVSWPLAHYKSAVRYLQRDPEVISATGGTNWQKYLPPRFQKVIFYPHLWTENEKEEWGKSWVLSTLENLKG